MSKYYNKCTVEYDSYRSVNINILSTASACSGEQSHVYIQKNISQKSLVLFDNPLFDNSLGELCVASFCVLIQQTELNDFCRFPRAVSKSRSSNKKVKT